MGFELGTALGVVSIIETKLKKLTFFCVILFMQKFEIGKINVGNVILKYKQNRLHKAEKRQNI